MSRAFMLGPVLALFAGVATAGELPPAEGQLTAAFARVVRFRDDVAGRRRPENDLRRTAAEAAARLRAGESLLARRWGRRLSARDVERETRRIGRETADPARLHQLWAAAGNAPLFEHTVVRPLLVQRELRRLYAADVQVHGALRRRLEHVLAEGGAEGLFADREAHVSITRLVQGDPAGESRTPGEIRLDGDAWVRGIGALAANFPRGLAEGAFSGIVETEESFFASRVERLDARGVALRTAQWIKPPFDAWWATESPSIPVLAGQEVAGPLPAPTPPPSTFPDGDCRARDTWLTMPVADPDLPAGRYHHTMVWTGSHVVVWGGYLAINAAPTNTGAYYDPLTGDWTPTPLPGAPPARAEHVAAWTGSDMIVWGGYDGTPCATSPTRGYPTDGGRLSPAAPGGATWSPIPPSAPVVEGTSGATAIWTGAPLNLFVAWGGIGPTPTCSLARRNRGGRLDAANAWATTSTAGPNVPGPRDEHTAIWTGSRMIVWGGLAAGALADGGSYDPAADAWDPPPPASGAPAPRRRHTAIWTGGEMVVWGGLDGSTPRGDGARYVPAASAWKPVSPTGAPMARHDHSATWGRGGMVVWGGRTAPGGTPTDTGACYTPATDSWQATNVSGAPAARFGHLAVFTGAMQDKLLVWGGSNGSAALLASGGRYCPVCCTDPEVVCTDLCRDRTLPYPAMDWVQLPARSCLETVEDLCAAVPLAMTVTQRRSESAGVYGYDCRTRACAPAPGTVSPVPESGSCPSACFCLDPGEGYEITTSGPSRTQFRGEDAPYTIQFSAAERHLVSLPYDTPLRGANDLWLDIVGQCPGASPWVRMRHCDDSYEMWFGEDGGGSDFPLVAGLAYEIWIDVPCLYSPPLAAPTTRTPCECADADADGGGSPAYAGCPRGAVLDCAPANPSTWGTPGPPSNVTIVQSGSASLISWSAPLDQGGIGLTLEYDTLRSTTPSDFATGSPCLYSNSPLTSQTDGTSPPAGQAFSYLVRAQNVCGEGALGQDSAGSPRAGAPCP